MDADADQLPPWGDALAGATAGVLANAAVYPLDIIKTRLQVQVKKKPTIPSEKGESYASIAEQGLLKEQEEGEHHEDHHEYYHGAVDAVKKIFKKEGWAGLYAGMPGSLLGVASTNFAYFYWYSTLRHMALKRKSTPHLSTIQELSVGALAGALAQLFTIPVAVITTRQQTVSKKARKSLLETGKEIIAEDGLPGLWRGLKASLVLVINPSITYGAYQRLHEVFFEKKAHLGAWEAFLLGAMSKSMATLATQPLIVSKVTLQSKPKPGLPKFKTFGEVLKYIVEHEGLLGLFKGIGPQIGKGLLVQGVMMMIKEKMELLFLFLFALLRRVQAKRLAQAMALAKKV